MISDEQFEIISRTIKQSKISNKALQEDLIDHFCCFVEGEMQKGYSFEKAFQTAYKQTTPNGFEEIQKETFYLLNYKKLLRINQFTYISGYIFALSVTIGVFFKFMYLPGATAFLYGGMLGIAFIFLPLFLANKFKNRLCSQLSEKLKWILGTISFVLFITACLFKLLHLQGAGFLLGFGFLLFGLGFLPFLFFRMFKAGQAEI
jgi:hypothetical protein